MREREKEGWRERERDRHTEVVIDVEKNFENSCCIFCKIKLTTTNRGGQSSFHDIIETKKNKTTT